MAKREPRTYRGALTDIRGFLSSRSGAGAVEFALVAPILLILYIGAAEVSVALSVNKKVARASSTVADLVTQKTAVDKAYLKTMLDVSQSILSPYGGSKVKLKLTEIATDSAGNAKVVWSWDQDGKRPYKPGNSVAIPDDLKIKDVFLVRSELSYDHRLLMMVPGSNDIDVSTITLGKTSYLRQRSGKDQIDCSDC